MDIFKRELAGEEISISDPDYYQISELIIETQKIIAELNTGYHAMYEVRKLMNKLTGCELDKLFHLFPPFYADLGKNIIIGKEVLINAGCTFMARGGIAIGDKVIIGPRVSLITISHPTDSAKREKEMSTFCKPIVIQGNVLIGAGATIMPGIIIGKNSIISPGVVVTSDVPSNSIVTGTPPKVVKNVEDK